MGENIVLGCFLLLPCAAIAALRLFARHMRGRKLPVRWPQILFGNVLVLLLLASPVLPAAEIYYRFIYDTTDSLAYTKVSQHWIQRHWHLNQNGTRDNIEY